MSTPIPNFRKLTISPIMQSTRSVTSGTERRGYGKGKGKAVAQEEDSSDAEEESDHDEESHGSTSEEETDTSEPDHLFAVDHCRQHGPRYAFQLAYAPVERYGIRINRTEPSECSCQQTNCRHYRWLLEEIARGRDGSLMSPPVSPHDRISGIGLKNICEEMHWEMREGHEDQEETAWLLRKDYSVQVVRRQTRHKNRERMRVVRDIMATLSPILPHEYRRDIFDALDELPDNPLVVRDMESTLILLLIKNDEMFYQFQDLVSRDIRASEFFHKMAAKSREALNALDHYCEHGSVAGQPQHDLIWCAQALVDIVRSIAVNITERQPLSPESRTAAVSSLISILRVVVRERNVDTYQYSTIPRRRPHGEQSLDRNLYERLIGCGSSSKNPSGGNFILDVLQDLPEARLYLEDLEEVQRLLGTIGWGPAPRAYRNKLERIIAQLKGETGPSPGAEEYVAPTASTSSGKRHAGSLDRKAKRMK